MKFCLLICTYQRRDSIARLLASIKKQTSYPDQILIVDGSRDDHTKALFDHNEFQNLTYIKIEKQHRGLTRQRNFGLDLVKDDMEVVCFLDDDTVLKPDYFEQVIKTFETSKDIMGVGGVAINENLWQKTEKKTSTSKVYVLEGHERKESQRFYLRNLLGLQSPELPSIMPDFSHGRTYGYPLTGKVYEVDLLVGMAMSFRSSVFDTIRFSTYFEGYGLYEDADLSLRVLKFGKNVLNTNAQVEHYHAVPGRPNAYDYGKMVIRNGWYVWRIKYPKPSIKARLKWNATAYLLTLIRSSNALISSKKGQVLQEVWGRTVGWWSLIFNKPKIQ